MKKAHWGYQRGTLTKPRRPTMRKPPQIWTQTMYGPINSPRLPGFFALPIKSGFVHFLGTFKIQFEIPIGARGYVTSTVQSTVTHSAHTDTSRSSPKYFGVILAVTRSIWSVNGFSVIVRRSVEGATMEKLFVQIFERKNRIIEQVKQQTEFYNQNLASKLLIEGITPPSWLWSPAGSSDSKGIPERSILGFHRFGVVNLLHNLAGRFPFPKF